jgi:signal transduction histidine kinase
LRLKLVLSYLGVTLGAIVFLALAVGFAVQNYYADVQTRMLQGWATGYKNNLIYPVYRIEGTLDIRQIEGLFRADPIPVLLVLKSTEAHAPQLCTVPAGLDTNNCNNPQIQAALQKATQTQQDVKGSLNVDDQNGAGAIATRYLATPLIYNGKMIGVMFLLATPVKDPSSGFLSKDPSSGFLSEVNYTILLAGILMSCIVVAFSFILARRFTKPIEQLTDAAEHMKSGKYTQRVPEPASQDELGILALTFNEMADTIEADVNELHRHEQSRRELIANIAHDLATPLTAIQGFSEALADDVIVDPQQRLETVQRIGREVQRLRRLVADVQHMTSLEAGRIHMDFAPLDMHELVDETLVVIATECENKGITVSNEIDPTAPTVMADSDRVTQVLLNLLDNARRHTPEGGKLTVGAQPDGRFLRIWVSDTGVGIDTQDLPYIFERFYRADRSRTTATGGSGLGLAIVKAIITAHGGRIWAQSTPGQGTTITFTLPLAQQNSQSPANASKELTKTS